MSWRSASSGKPWFRAASWSSSSVISGPAAVFMRLFEAVDEEHGVGLDVVDLDACRLGHLFSYLFPAVLAAFKGVLRSEEHTSELQSRENLVCRLLLEKKKK